MENNNKIKLDKIIAERVKLLTSCIILVAVFSLYRFYSLSYNPLEINYKSIFNTFSAVDLISEFIVLLILSLISYKKGINVFTFKKTGWTKKLTRIFVKLNHRKVIKNILIGSLIVFLLTLLMEIRNMNHIRGSIERYEFVLGTSFWLVPVFYSIILSVFLVIYFYGFAFLSKIENTNQIKY